MGRYIYLIIIEPIKLIIEIAYTLIYYLLGSPGLSVLAVSLVVNLLVLPMYRRADAIQEEERLRMKRMEPGIAHIKRTFSDKEQYMRLNAYYRTEHYSPASSLRTTLSLLLQIPFFIAAYNYLSELTVLKGASFWGIPDLGEADGLLMISGVRINLLPILMTLINAAAGFVYLRGAMLREKIQTYGIAAVFLLLLYNSPAGLVLYWTCNQVFSLGKNLVMHSLKIRNADALKKPAQKEKDRASEDARKNDSRFSACKSRIASLFCEAESDTGTFAAAAIFLTLLVGLLIPSALIADSPQEFIDITNFINPIRYIGASLCIAAGLFLLWGGIMYAMAGRRTKTRAAILYALAGAAALLNYMFFGRDHGTITPLLKYLDSYFYSKKLVLLNIALILVIWTVLLKLRKKYQAVLTYMGIVFAAAALFLAVPNLVSVYQGAETAHRNYAEEGGNDSTSIERVHDKILHFSTSEQNVVVMMLDRFIGGYIPYLMQESPILKEQFEGFTYYRNTLAYGTCTNFAVPALFGGYEYTPTNMNKRNTEPLMDKHNEALKMMPLLFSENGYDVTVTDPPYAGYQWLPDLSIYKDLPKVNAYNLLGKYRSDLQGIYLPLGQSSFERNLFMYAVFKSVPFGIQGFVYDEGNYLSLQSTMPDTLKFFIDRYSVIVNLINLTDVSESFGPQLLLFQNDTTHEALRMQLPDYSLSAEADNSAYEAPERFVLPDGSHVNMTSDLQYAHYETDMAVLLRVGEWLDYLREAGVYDNTRIIIVSDHGRAFRQFDELIVDDLFDAEGVNALLMVKDFNSEGPFETSEEFMTIADTPTLAVNGVIENPVNPYTGKEITNEDKYTQDQVITDSDHYYAYPTMGPVFDTSDKPWYSIHDSIWIKENWKRLETP